MKIYFPCLLAATLLCFAQPAQSKSPVSIQIRNIDPGSETQTVPCFNDGKPCFLSLEMADGAALDIAININQNVAQLRFMRNRRYQSLSPNREQYGTSIELTNGSGADRIELYNPSQIVANRSPGFELVGMDTPQPIAVLNIAIQKD